MFSYSVPVLWLSGAGVPNRGKFPQGEARGELQLRREESFKERIAFQGIGRFLAHFAEVIIIKTWPG